MTTEQIWTVSQLLDNDLTMDSAAHGDCVGADEDFHRLARLSGLYIIGHPPLNNSKRAFCKFDEERSPQEYLVRNKNIVDGSFWMIFTPPGFEEETRSGTWSTIRYARQRGSLITIVWPDGTK